MLANYDFKSDNPDDLNFQRGDIIYVLNANDPDWWLGEIRRADDQVSRGLFPKNFVSPY